ncbi:hypothetical protein RAA17_04275 [Komagataeibacter rhaeticus]|nr:hypothetical protein [Komagataeibacter rhaeticus]
MLNRLFPGYDALVQAHVAADPLAAGRLRLSLLVWHRAARQAGVNGAVLLVTHGGPVAWPVSWRRGRGNGRRRACCRWCWSRKTAASACVMAGRMRPVPAAFCMARAGRGAGHVPAGAGPAADRDSPPHGPWPAGALNCVRCWACPIWCMCMTMPGSARA